MSIPQELHFNDEAAFIDGFLVPLLIKMGFSVIDHYHGKREFGKDLVFADIDRFGHINYFGMQAKYVRNITLNSVQDIINDCQQAFANPFRHPRTGATERISSFYVVNGGTFSDEARDHFFSSVAYPFGGNVRLIDGKTLLVMNRVSTANRIETFEEYLRGILFEIGINEYSLGIYEQQLSQICKRETTELIRLRTEAASQYVLRPIAYRSISVGLVLRYWQSISAFNKLLDILASSNTNEETALDNARKLIESSRGEAELIKTAVRKTLDALAAEKMV